MTYRDTARQKLTLIVGILMLCTALVGTAGASGRHHRSSVRGTAVRQSTRATQTNTNTANVAAVGGTASASCTISNGSNTATGALAIAVNLNACLNTAAGAPGTAANTGAITQAAANMITATNTSNQ